MAQILTLAVIFACDMDYRSCQVAVVPVCAADLHELSVSAIVCLAFNYSLYAFSCDLGYFTYQILIDMSLMSPDDRLCNRMARKALAACSNIQEFSFADQVRMYVIYRKYTFCKRSSLIEDNSIDLGQYFHISGALYEDTVLGSAADAAEERQRNRYDKCAGAGYYKEYAGSRKPFFPDIPASDA